MVFNRARHTCEAHAMFKIGEFARLLGVSVRTLRYYEDVGLFRARRGAANDYRLYDATHLQRLRRILALRDLGFSIERIKQAMDAEDDAQEVDLRTKQFRTLLRAHYDDLRREHERLGEQLRRLETHLKEIPMYHPEIRSILAQR